MRFTCINPASQCRLLQTDWTQIWPDKTSGLIWIWTALHSGDIPERFIRRSWFWKKSADDKKHEKFSLKIHSFLYLLYLLLIIYHSLLTGWTQIRSDKISDLIRIQSVWHSDGISERLLLNKSKKEGKDQELIQSSSTPDPGYQWKSYKLTIRHHNESYEVSPFSAGDHKALINRRVRKHNKNKTEIT